MFVPQHPWANKAAKVILQKLVSQVPLIGSILSDVVTIIWPAPACDEPTAEEKFEEIREQVAAMFNEQFDTKFNEKMAEQRGWLNNSAENTVSVVVPSTDGFTCDLTCDFAYDFVVENQSAALVECNDSASVIQMTVGEGSAVDWVGTCNDEAKSPPVSPVSEEPEMVMVPLVPLLAVA